MKSESFLTLMRLVLSWMVAETVVEEKKSLNKVVIFVFFAQKVF